MTYRSLARRAWILISACALLSVCSCHPSPPPGGASTPTLLRYTNASDGSELVYVSPGPFTMGSDIGEVDEQPVHTVDLAGYWIGTRLVTNRQFAAFLNTVGLKTEHGVPWYSCKDRRHPLGIEARDGKFVPPAGFEDNPVVGVSWYGARAYCEWAGLRLPTEAEWEKAARGTNGLTWPWGNAWSGTLANAEAEDGGPKVPTVPVGTYPDGASPYGCLDMAGNAWEWCSSLYAGYPYVADDGRESAQGEGPRVVRGGGWNRGQFYVRTSNRYRIHWYYAGGLDRRTASATGFRVAASHTPADPSAAPSAASPSAHASQTDVRRIAHPPMAPMLPEKDATPAAELDRKYRLGSGPFPSGQILGYPVDRERESRYSMPLERLDDLARESRDRDTQPEAVLAALNLRAGDIAADVGAGSGYFTRNISKAVGPKGEAWATDISIVALNYIATRLKKEPDWPNPARVFLVLHDVADCLLPAHHFDVVFMSQAHYFHYPRAKNGSSPPLAQVLAFYGTIARSLKADGRFVIWEDSERHPEQDPERGTLSPTEIEAQMAQAGFELVSHRDVSYYSQGKVPAVLLTSRDLFVFRLRPGVKPSR